MKSFKDIRSQVNEEYYSGPTTYVGGDKTNVGDIAGSDLGNLSSGGAKKPYATPNNMAVLEKALNQELHGIHLDPVQALSKAGTKFSSTGLVFDVNSANIRNAAMRNETYQTALTFGGHPLGEAPDTNPANDFAAREIGSGMTPYEKTLPETTVSFSFEAVGTGYKISASFV